MLPLVMLGALGYSAYNYFGSKKEPKNDAEIATQIASGGENTQPTANAGGFFDQFSNTVTGWWNNAYKSTINWFDGSGQVTSGGNTTPAAVAQQNSGKMTAQSVMIAAAAVTAIFLIMRKK